MARNSEFRHCKADLDVPPSCHPFFFWGGETRRSECRGRTLSHSLSTETNFSLLNRVERDLCMLSGCIDSILEYSAATLWSIRGLLASFSLAGLTPIVARIRKGDILSHSHSSPMEHVAIYFTQHIENPRPTKDPTEHIAKAKSTPAPTRRLGLERGHIHLITSLLSRECPITVRKPLI
jgi:hypothetical protein